MKNFFVVSAVFCIFTTTTFTAAAQPAPGFIEGLEFKPQAVAYHNPPDASKNVMVSAPITNTSGSTISTEDCRSYQFKYAQLLNRDVESLTNTSLFKFIENWWDTRYRYGGNSRSGIDCSAFTALLCLEVFQKSLPRTAREQFASAQKIEVADLSEGDLVFFNTRGGVSHVGVYLSDGYFVHASNSSGVTINNLNENYYSNRFLGAGRLP